MLRYEQKVIFEDFDFDAREGAEDIAAVLAPLIFEDKDLQSIFQQRFCIVHDDVMSFLSRNATDVVTRIAMNSETKTVKKGQLWTEENLPAETILSALVTHIPTRAPNGGSPFKHLSHLTRGEVQLGGKATVGRGRCLTRVLGGKE